MSSYSNKIKGLLERANRRLFGPTLRATNDYATHLPILVGLGRSVRVQSVLELGCGKYSTPTFLNRDVFPDLQLLDSYETDPVWAATISTATTNDPRSTLKLVDGVIADSLPNIDFEDYDLIFVDDSENAEDRTKTISYLVERRPRRPFVVLHDYEVAVYAKMAKSFRHRYPFRVFNPETGVLWEERPIDRKPLKQIDTVLRKHARKLQPDDVPGWIEAFASALPANSK